MARRPRIERMEPVLISAEELAASDPKPALLDVRWQLGGPDGHTEYLKGHIPGAVFVDMENELARHGEPTDGRHPLPAIEDLQAAARRWGVRDRVVVYDATGGLAAARAWWLLRWAGVRDVRILDGGLQAWPGALATDEVTPEPSTIELSPGHMPTLELEDVQGFAGTLLDARAGERYRGETEPIDPKAGHIPGARSAPTTENLQPDGRFKTPEALRERFKDVEGDVAVYCGSGVTAAHEIAALRIAGIEAALYPGSWSQWSNHDLPVQTGR
jgi:thiosulfate/3-mercaptopyruvate sulfurtransferase